VSAGPLQPALAGSSQRPESSRAPRPADDGPPAVLLLVRHGRTTLTEQRRFSGRGGVDPELSDAGRRDAAAVADLLARVAAGTAGLPDVGPVAAVVSSPLARTWQTACAIAERLDLTVTPDERWAEIAFGAWDGLTYAEVAERWPGPLRDWQGSTTAAPPGGESIGEFVVRVRSARAGLVADHPGRTVVVVTHVTPVRVLVQEALDAGPAALWRTRVSPCSVTAVRYWQDGGIELVTVNRLP